jgi:hypothetical protein
MVPLVTMPLIRVAPPDLLVGDTCALMNELVQATRNGHATSLLAAICHDAVRVYITRDVLIEIERDLPDYAVDRRVDPQAVMAAWGLLYRPLIIVVDVPDTWADGSPAVRSVLARHPVDAPTARLAATLAPCHVLTEDPDLTDYGFGDRDWLPLAHAFANQAELELVGSVVAVPTVIVAGLGTEFTRAAMRLPALWRYLLVTGLLGIAYLWQQDGRARRHLEKAGAVASRIGKVAGPTLVELMTRHGEAVNARRDRLVAPDHDRRLPEQIARHLAFAPLDGLLASDIAREVDHDGNLKDRTTAVRAVLQGSDAYVEVTRGRWRLGVPPSSDASTLTPDEVGQWIARAHRATLPQLETPPAPPAICAQRRT